jgi:NAD(P)-dependent dehydrogenase (short-subunit alcohol dehydrogenase family)
VSAAARGGRLAGRVALITGAGRGFGRTMAVAFALTGQVLQPNGGWVMP